MLTHYIIVRRDLPVGVLAAQITHAAGESGAIYQDADGRFRHAVAVVLEVKNESGLNETAILLWMHDIQHVQIHESGGPFDGQFMAIGLVPCEREKVSEILKDFQTLKTLDNLECNCNPWDGIHAVNCPKNTVDNSNPDH